LTRAGRSGQKEGDARHAPLAVRHTTNEAIKWVAECLMAVCVCERDASPSTRCIMGAGQQ